MENNVDLKLPECVRSVTNQTTAPFGRFIYQTKDGYSFAPIICQELWSRPAMFEYLLKNQVDIIFSGNGSCYRYGKIKSRERLLEKVSKNRGAIVYSNVKGKD
jgi:hypothetical protein